MNRGWWRFAGHVVAWAFAVGIPPYAAYALGLLPPPLWALFIGFVPFAAQSYMLEQREFMLWHDKGKQYLDVVSKCLGYLLGIFIVMWWWK